jgi:hypothetical protein
VWDNFPHQLFACQIPLSTRHRLVLHAVLRVLRPLVRLMLRHGVTYTAFATALKPVFLEAAREELKLQDMPVTDSALTLLSGVHRRDVRALTRGEDLPAIPVKDSPPASLAGEVVGRWMSDPAWLDGQGRPQVLSRADFDALVSAVSQDVRPRALRDELVRLGVVTCSAEGSVSLAAQGFAPRQGFAEMSALMADNLADHASAATANLQDGANFLEQALYVDRLSAPSAVRLHQAASTAWQQVLPGLLRQAQELYDRDQTPAAPADAAPTEPSGRVPGKRRVRLGVYFYDTEDDAP